MTHFHSSCLVLAVACAASLAAAPQVPQAPAPEGTAAQTYTVFLRSRPIGQETLTVLRQPDGWLLRGTGRLGPPLDLVTRVAEIQYDAKWQPVRLLLEGTSRGQDLSLKTTFADGQATTEVSGGAEPTSKTDTVALDTLVLPNAFLGSYAALAQRLVGQKPGVTFNAYIAPQGEVPMRLEGVFPERIETPREAIDATRYALTVSNPAPAGSVQISVWADPRGGLLRLSVPSQMLEVAREDVASAAARTTSFSIPGEETVRIPASGFSLAASIAKPAGATGRLPALVLIGGSGPIDRDGTVAGIPVLGQIAADLVKAGFLVVRYDKRGIGQSGGRDETATLFDYAEDVRAIVRWLDKRRDDVDKKKIGLVGHSEGALIAMRVGAQEKKVAAIALLAGPSTTGAEIVLEQQRYLLERMNAPAAEKDAKIELQKRINAATLSGEGWEDIPDQLRIAADSAWFRSFLEFDPAKAMKDVRQPVLVIQGALDTQVPPHHAERLAELARERRRKLPVDVVVIPGVNHLLVPAPTGDVAEYASLPDKQVSPAATKAIADWMTRILK